MGTMFNRRLINENRKKIKENGDADVTLTARVAALEGAGYSVVDPDPEGEATETLTKVEIDGTVYGISGGGGSTNLEAVTLAVASHSESTAATQPSSLAGDGVTIIHDGTRILGANFSVLGMPLTGDYAEFFKGLTLTLNATALAAGDLPIGGYTGVATAEEIMTAKDNGFVVYKIWVGTNMDESLSVTVKIIDIIKADNSNTVTGIVY